LRHKRCRARRKSCTPMGHEDLNRALRTNTMDASQQARADALARALHKFPPHRGPVLRGTDLPSEVIAQYQPGSVITENGFLSTTMDFKIARSPAFAGNVGFRIRSSTARDISSFSIIPGEREVLFRLASSFMWWIGRQIPALVKQSLKWLKDKGLDTWLKNSQRRQTIRRISGEDRSRAGGTTLEIPRKFWDDTSGTEFEGWRDK
jgi:hypothetical protein